MTLENTEQRRGESLINGMLMNSVIVELHLHSPRMTSPRYAALQHGAQLSPSRRHIEILLRVTTLDLGNVDLFQIYFPREQWPLSCLRVFA